MKKLDLTKGLEEYSFYTIIAYDESKAYYLIKTWEGYIDDIYEQTQFKNGSLIGFSKLYHSDILSSDDHDLENPYTDIDKEEYLEDLKMYISLEFECSETKELLLKIIELFEYAISHNLNISIAYEYR